MLKVLSELDCYKKLYGEENSYCVDHYKEKHGWVHLCATIDGLSFNVKNRRFYINGLNVCPATFDTWCRFNDVSKETEINELRITKGE